MSLATFTSDLKDYLVAQGIGTFSTDLFVGAAPPDARDCVVVMPYGGRESDNIHGSAFPRVQITARAATFQAAETKAFAVYAALNEREAFDLKAGGTHVTWCQALQPPFPMGQDANQKFRHTANYEFTIRAT